MLCVPISSFEPMTAETAGGRLFSTLERIFPNRSSWSHPSNTATGPSKKRIEIENLCVTENQLFLIRCVTGPTASVYSLECHDSEGQYGTELWVHGIGEYSARVGSVPPLIRFRFWNHNCQVIILPSDMSEHDLRSGYGPAHSQILE